MALLELDTPVALGAEVEGDAEVDTRVGRGPRRLPLALLGTEVCVNVVTGEQFTQELDEDGDGHGASDEDVVVGLEEAIHGRQGTGGKGGCQTNG